MVYFQSMDYKLSAKYVWSNAYNNLGPIVTARRGKTRLFRAYFSAQI